MTVTSNCPLRSKLSQFRGDLERFRSIVPGVIYTPGIRYLAEQAHAYWLIHAIASHFLSDQMHEAERNDERIRRLHVWKLVVDQNGSARLTAQLDSDEWPFIEQCIGYTDFPMDDIEIWCGHDGRHWTLYLPSEH